jgi:hypothetical protein
VKGDQDYDSLLGNDFMRKLRVPRVTVLTHCDKIEATSDGRVRIAATLDRTSENSSGTFAVDGSVGITTEEAIAMQRNLITTDVACDRGECRVSVLIDPSVDHPGAGACIVDDAVSETQLEELRKLWESLPVSECDEISGGDATKSHESRRVEGEDGRGIDETSRNKVAYRPTRHYFCDADGAVRAMLEGCVEAARAALALPGGRVESSSTNTTHGRRVPPSSVFQNIRFLHYERAGGILPPHVDLCRVDDASGLRSTHTFILYLFHISLFQICACLCHVV